MRRIDIEQAGQQLARLIDGMERGETVVLERAGRPVATIARIEEDAAFAPLPRIGFLKGEITMPEDFDRMGSREIERLFNGEE
jgi:antitoxin (DNA-binding transcriptional repressor) of toxin-antitoxin stability system